jgi:hypothetical protein
MMLMMVEGARKMSEIDALIGKAGDPVSVVDAADIKVMWAHGQKLKTQHPRGLAVEVGIYKRICSPGADIRAVSYRCQMLGLLEMMLQAAWTGGEPSANAFKVAARMDLHWMAVGTPQNGFPFSVDFLQKRCVRLSSRARPNLPRTMRKSKNQSRRVTHPNIVLFDVRVGFRGKSERPSSLRRYKECASSSLQNPPAAALRLAMTYLRP